MSRSWIPLRLPRPFVVVAVIIGVVAGVWAWYYAPSSEIDISIDNQTGSLALISVYIDGEGFGHERSTQFINYSSSVDFRATYSVARGSHTLLIEAVSPALSYRCNVHLNFLGADEIHLVLTNESLART
jgi:hypothetical protein